LIYNVVVFPFYIFRVYCAGVGGRAQWLGRRSLAGGHSPDVCPTYG